MASKTKKILLLVEDDKDIVDVYTSAFKAAKINFEVMSSGKQVIEHVKKIQAGEAEKPGLVLLDLLLPDINGLEVLKEIKGHEETKDIIVYVLSNYTAGELLKPATVQPDKFILKTSITPSELIKLVKKIIK